MPLDFVRYRAGIERADPDFDKNPQTVLEGMKRNMEGSDEPDNHTFDYALILDKVPKRASS